MRLLEHRVHPLPEAHLGSDAGPDRYLFGNMGVGCQKLSEDNLGEPSALIQARVEVAREQQRQRFVNE